MFDQPLFIKAILLGLVGVVGILDSRLLGRSNLEQPLVMSTLVGLVLGDILAGLMIGAALQLVFMGFVNIGAASPPDIVYGAIIATSVIILTGIWDLTNPEKSVSVAVPIAIPVAILGQMLGIFVRMLMSGFTYLSRRAIQEGNFKRAVRYHIVWGSISYSLLYFIPIFLTIWIGTEFVDDIVKSIPQWLTDSLTVASKLLPAFGFALLMRTMVSKKTVVYLLLGFFLNVYGNVSIIGVAIFAILLAIILNELLPKLNTEKEVAQTVPSSTSSDELEEL